jgi:hypothetical protein
VEDVPDDDAEGELDEGDRDPRLDRHHARHEHDHGERCSKLNRVHPVPSARQSVEAISPGAGG